MSELKKWKNKAWKAFSEYIRRKHANLDGFVECVTCGERKHWKEVDAGHFVPGRNNTVLYDERLVHPQCKSCNRNHGEQFKYAQFLKSEYGYTDEQIEGFLSLKNVTKRMTASEHREVFELYREQLKDVA